jgi:hypothetical protein
MKLELLLFRRNRIFEVSYIWKGVSLTPERKLEKSSLRRRGFHPVKHHVPFLEFRARNLSQISVRNTRASLLYLCLCVLQHASNIYTRRLWYSTELHSLSLALLWSWNCCVWLRHQSWFNRVCFSDVPRMRLTPAAQRSHRRPAPNSINLRPGRRVPPTRPRADCCVSCRIWIYNLALA